MSSNTVTKEVDGQPVVGLSLRRRLFLGFAAIILVFTISTAITLSFVWRVKNDTDHLLNIGVAITKVVDDLQVAFSSVSIVLQSYVIFHGEEDKKKLLQSLDGFDSLMLVVNSDIDNTHDSVIMQKWTDLQRKLKDYRSNIDIILSSISAGKQEEAISIYKNKTLPLITTIYAAFNVDDTVDKSSAGILDLLSFGMIADISDIEKQVGIVTIVVIGFLVFAAILSIFIAGLTSRSILRPLKYAIGVAIRIAAGERSMDTTTTRSDEAGQLITALGEMRDAIKSGEDAKQQYADNIMRACSSMVSTLDEVRHAVDAQSSGASEQASSINQITASISEIEKSAIQTMNKARDLGGVAEKTRASGQQGLESIESSVLGMQSVRSKVQLIAQTILDLSRQTQQVGEITSVVNNLAQQSKMLALNASIEAAKAGDAGKGFTVVASEVKNLAEQSEQSTAQVQKILEDIKVATEKAVMVTEEGTKGLDNGLQMIERTGEVIRDLNEVIREATIASQQIEAAVRQESAGIEQITAGMNEVNTVTTSFISSVSQTTEAMEDLANVTRKLKDSVETYKS